MHLETHSYVDAAAARVLDCGGAQRPRPVKGRGAKVGHRAAVSQPIERLLDV